MTARTPENRLWVRTLKPHVPTILDVRRLEPRIPPGVPDLYWSGGTQASRSGWVELKSGVGVVRPLQKNWLRDQRRNGVPAHVVAELHDRLWLFDGLTGIDQYDKLLFGQEEASWPMNGIDHEELWDMICGSNG